MPVLGTSAFSRLAPWAQGRLELVLVDEDLKFLPKKRLRLGLNQKRPLVKVSNDELLTAAKERKGKLVIAIFPNELVPHTIAQGKGRRPSKHVNNKSPTLETERHSNL